MGTITVTGLGKAYKKYPSRRARLAEWVLPFGGPRHSLSWILQDINFTVNPGEAVGLIGINGAGKSTLLKMITGTTQPTTGGVHISGRVAAMLELGMGFHPDFSGRQNVFMAAQLLGYAPAEVTELLPSIIEFAEIGEYIDQPVRVYSSGMQMRLAFSVATARRPDVLIVDEALSVGDTYFQHKSFERIRNFRQQGTTLLLVSHDKGVIQSICDRAILLNAGKLEMEGAPEAVMDYYNAMLAEKENSTVRQLVTADGRIQTISGTQEASVTDIALLDATGQRIEVVDVGAPVTLEISFEVRQPIERLVLGYMIKDRLGQEIFGTNTHHLETAEEHLQPGDRRTYRFHFDASLGEGSYSVATNLADADTHLAKNYEWRDLALVFQVMNMSQSFFVGSIFLPTRQEVLPFTPNTSVPAGAAANISSDPQP
jgi:lipopolysaccharide transport system ATP-binding protein